MKEQDIANKYIGLAKALKEQNIDVEVSKVIIEQCGKEFRMKTFRESKEEQKGEPATSKQLEFISKLGGEFEPGITKTEASELIEKLKSKKNGNNN